MHALNGFLIKSPNTWWYLKSVEFISISVECFFLIFASHHFKHHHSLFLFFWNLPSPFNFSVTVFASCNRWSLIIQCQCDSSLKTFFPHFFSNPHYIRSEIRAGVNYPKNNTWQYPITEYNVSWQYMFNSTC